MGVRKRKPVSGLCLPDRDSTVLFVSVQAIQFNWNAAVAGTQRLLQIFVRFEVVAVSVQPLHSN